MKRILLLLLLATSACAQSGQGEPSFDNHGHIIPACEDQSDKSNVMRRVSSDAFGSSLGQTVCTKSDRYGLVIEPKIRMISYKNGMADLEFLCDKNDALNFFKKESGKKVYLVFKGIVVGSASAAHELGEGRCVLPYLENLDEAVSICEKFSRVLRFNADQCYETCDVSDREKQVCFWSKLGSG